MMGNPHEGNGHANGGVGQDPSGRGRQNATFSGATALLAIIALILEIIVVAVPHWGYYQPKGAAYYASGEIFFFQRRGITILANIFGSVIFILIVPASSGTS